MSRSLVNADVEQVRRHRRGEHEGVGDAIVLNRLCGPSASSRVPEAGFGKGSRTGQGPGGTQPHGQARQVSGKDAFADVRKCQKVLLIVRIIEEASKMHAKTTRKMLEKMKRADLVRPCPADTEFVATEKKVVCHRSPDGTNDHRADDLGQKQGIFCHAETRIRNFGFNGLFSGISCRATGKNS